MQSSIDCIKDANKLKKSLLICLWSDSNRHVARHQFLKLARLPFRHKGNKVILYIILLYTNILYISIYCNKNNIIPIKESMQFSIECIKDAMNHK